MKVTITGRHCDVPKKIIDRTELQFSKLVKFQTRATHADVIYVDEGHSKRVEGIVFVDGAPQVAARGDGENFRAALSQLVDRLRRQLKEQREQLTDHQAPPLTEGLEALDPADPDDSE